MRVAGALSILAGVLAVVVLALQPVQVAVLGTTGSCGAPLLAVFQSEVADSPTELDLVQQCRSESMLRLGIGAAAGAVLGAGGFVMLKLARQAERGPRRPRPLSEPGG